MRDSEILKIFLRTNLLTSKYQFSYGKVNVTLKKNET